MVKCQYQGVTVYRRTILVDSHDFSCEPVNFSEDTITNGQWLNTCGL